MHSENNYTNVNQCVIILLQLQDFLESNYLNEQVDSIRQLAGYVNQVRNLKVTNPGLGEHLFNEKLSKKNWKKLFK